MPKKKSQDKKRLDMFGDPYVFDEDALEHSGGSSNEELMKQLKKIAGQGVFSPSDLEKNDRRLESN
jgi:hypothetical protein